eukprot:Skav222677  [mRNA]  locus=scaffold1471:6935:8029:- [translate_table: standard]
MFFVSLLLVSIWSGADGPLFQVARLLGVLATLGETTSTAAGQAINVTGALASAASEVITSATSNGLNTAENVWRGIDVSQLEADRCAGILTVDGPEALEQWLNTSAASLVIPCLTPDLKAQLLAATASIALTLPSIQSATESLELLSEFNATKVWAHLTPDGRTQVHYELVHLRFLVYWANPLWTNLDLDLASERDQILRLLRLAVISLPSPTPATGIRTLELEVHVSWPVLVSKVKMFARQLLMQLSTLIDDTFRGGGSVSFQWWLLPCTFALLLTWPLWIRKLCFWTASTPHMVPLAVLDGQAAEDDAPFWFEPPPSPDVQEDLSSSGASSFAMLTEQSDVSSVHSFLFEANGGEAVKREDD